jgi:hypothetical protein
VDLMKKTFIAVALSSVFAVPAVADTTIYGNFRGSINTGDLNSADNSADFVNNASRIGVKGSAGTDTLKGIYHLQMGVNTDGGDEDALSKRFYFAGLKGGFGKVIYGRLSTPYKMAGVKQDPFYDTSAGPANGGSNYGYSSLNNGFTDSTIAYYSPKFGGGMSASASLSIDDAATDDHDVGVGLEYANDNFKVGVAHLNLGDTPVVGANGGAEKATRIYGSTKMGAVGVNASYEQVDFAAGGDATFAHINGTYKMSDKAKLAASYGAVDGDGTGARNAPGKGFSAGVFYNVLKNTQLSALYSSVDYDAGNERNGIALGVVQKF